MKNLEISLELLPASSRNTNKAGIYFGGNGVIQLSFEAVERFQLTARCHVAIARDPKRTADWYLLVSEKEVNGFATLREKAGAKGLFFNSSSWSRKAVEEFAAEGKKSIKFLLGAEALAYETWKAIPIITKSGH